MSNLSSTNSAKLSNFEKKVYLSLTKVQRGKVVTYATLAGFPGAARAIGNAMNKNPFAPTLLCHRVVKNDGSLGGFAHRTRRKMELLRSGKVFVENEKIADFEKIKLK